MSDLLPTFDQFVEWVNKLLPDDDKWPELIEPIYRRAELDADEWYHEQYWPEEEE